MLTNLLIPFLITHIKKDSWKSHLSSLPSFFSSSNWAIIFLFLTFPSSHSSPSLNLALAFFHSYSYTPPLLPLLWYSCTLISSKHRFVTHPAAWQQHTSPSPPLAASLWGCCAGHSLLGNAWRPYILMSLLQSSACAPRQTTHRKEGIVWAQEASQGQDKISVPKNFLQITAQQKVDRERSQNKVSFC